MDQFEELRKLLATKEAEVSGPKIPLPPKGRICYPKQWSWDKEKPQPDDKDAPSQE